MSHTMRFFPEVAEDALAGHDWYEGRVRGLGEEFLRAFHANFPAIARNPMLCAEVGHGFRRCLIRRFPYAVYLRVEGQQVIVVGVFHCARDPRNIAREIRERDSRNEDKG